MTETNPEKTDLGSKFQEIPLAQLAPSKSNPRRGYDDAAMKELAASIGEQGVIEPLVVRPAGKNGDFEIVAGERRYRAAKIAKVGVLPCLVRELTDAQALEIQLIENLQREDVRPLDEGLGYKTLIAKAGYNVEKLAQRVGKSASYVYQRMKLADLAPAAQKQLEAGEINAGQAILIARLEKPAQQRVLKDARQGWGKDQRILPVKPLGEWIQREIHRDLEAAPWVLDDATLLPAAGACSICPKRAGANPGMSDLQASTCTDPQCFAAKGQLFIERRLAELKKAGEKAFLISEHYSKWTGAPPGVLYSNDWKEAGKKQCAHQVKGILLDGSRAGQTLSICATSKCRKHWQSWEDDHRRAESPAARSRGAKAAQEAARRTKLIQKAQESTLHMVLERLPALQGNSAIIALVAWRFFADIWHESKKKIGALVGIAPKKEQYRFNWDEPARAWIEKANAQQLTRLLVACALAKEISGGLYGQKPALPTLARDLKINPEKIRREVFAEARAKTKPKSHTSAKRASKESSKLGKRKRLK